MPARAKNTGTCVVNTTITREDLTHYALSITENAVSGVVEDQT